MHNQFLGKRGEDIAAGYLVRKGLRVIARNFRVRYGEIDIVALDGDALVFVEVKTRTGTGFGEPEEAVTGEKLAEITKTGAFFASLHPELPALQRIDVVAVRIPANGSAESVRHLESVTSFG